MQIQTGRRAFATPAMHAAGASEQRVSVTFDAPFPSTPEVLVSLAGFHVAPNGPVGQTSCDVFAVDVTPAGFTALVRRPADGPIYRVAITFLAVALTKHEPTVFG